MQKTDGKKKGSRKKWQSIVLAVLALLLMPLATVGTAVAGATLMLIGVAKEFYRQMIAGAAAVAIGLLAKEELTPDQKNVAPTTDYANELLDSTVDKLDEINESILDLDSTFRAVLDSISPHDDREHRY